MGQGCWGNAGTLILTNVLLKVFAGPEGYIVRTGQRLALLAWKSAHRKSRSRVAMAGYIRGKTGIASSPSDEKALRKEEAQRLKAERERRKHKKK